MEVKARRLWPNSRGRVRRPRTFWGTLCSDRYIGTGKSRRGERGRFLEFQIEVRVGGAPSVRSQSQSRAGSSQPYLPSSRSSAFRRARQQTADRGCEPKWKGRKFRTLDREGGGPLRGAFVGRKGQEAQADFCYPPQPSPSSASAVRGLEGAQGSIRGGVETDNRPSSATEQYICGPWVWSWPPRGA